MAKNEKKDSKTWQWANRRINVGAGWTLISTECYLEKHCEGCIYWRYCHKTCENGGLPILKQVTISLFSMYGEPPRHFIDKLKEIEYNDEHWW